jgi:dTDP-4-amino-4,6-dideoxygalactose transaminase
MQKVKKINYLNFPEEVRQRKKEYMSAVERVLTSGIYILNREVEDFEKKLAKYLGVKYCVGTANGLEAIQIALMALNIDRGDEVITTPISAVATTLAIMAVGATPVFVDVNERGQIDTDKLEEHVTKKTKAILPVDLYGQPCDIDKIKAICRKHRLYLIEDACQAHGATLKGKKLGTYGDIGCFSFYPTKNLGAFGDGGALVTNNKKVAEIVRQLRDYGQERKYVHARYGLNSRLDELHAALLSVKLKYLDKDNRTRRKMAKRYISQLKGVKNLEIVLPDNINDSNFHLFVVKTKRRDALQKFLKENGIPSLIHYPLTIPQQPVIKKAEIKTGNLPVSKRFVKEILSLPCHPFMKLSEVDYVTDKIEEFFERLS